MDYLYVLALDIFIGISRTSLDSTGWYVTRECTDGWFIHFCEGGLWGNSKQYDDMAGGYDQGGRVGVLLDLGAGSLRFFRNGAQHGLGYTAGSVAGPVVVAVQMDYHNDSARLLLPNAQQPE